MKNALILAATVLLAGCATAPAGEPLTEERMAAVRNGMSAGEVEQLLGRPDGGTATYMSGETVSGWRLHGGAAAAYFNVHYRDGRVVRTSRSLEPNVP